MNKKELYQRQYNISKAKLQEGWKDIINYAQLGVDVASIPMSFVPGLNLVASGLQAASAAVDVAQGETEDAAWRAGAAALGLLPGAGGVAAGAKLAAQGTKAVKAATTAAKVADVVADVTKGVKAGAKAADVAVDVSKATKAAKVADIAADASKAAKAVDTAGDAATMGNAIVAKNALAQTQRTAASTANTQASLVKPAREVTVRRITQAIPEAKPRFSTFTHAGSAGKDFYKAGFGDELASLLGKAKPGSTSKAISRAITAARGANVAGKASNALRALGKTAVAAGVGAAVGAVGKTVYDTVTSDDESEPTKKDKSKESEEPSGSKSSAGLDVGALNVFDPGSVAGYGRSAKTERQDTRGSTFRNPWSISPELVAARNMTSVDSRGRVVSVTEEMNKGILSQKVKTAVSSYLKSKHGKELNNHLNTISKALKSDQDMV